MTGRGGEEEFLECHNTRVGIVNSKNAVQACSRQADELNGASVLGRNWFAGCGKGAEVVRHRVQCSTLPELMKKYGAPKVIDYLSLDLEQTESLSLVEIWRSAKGRGHALHLR